MTPEQFDAFWTPARLAALEAAAEPWMADEATYAAWTRTHPAPTLATCCGLAVQVGLVTEGLRHYQARAQAAEGERDAARLALGDVLTAVSSFRDDLQRIGLYGSSGSGEDKHLVSLAATTVVALLTALRNVQAVGRAGAGDSASGDGAAAVRPS